jgi:hypothetical protein
MNPMMYEMRVYRCLPGRLPALLKRFENTTLKMWEKHGIKQAGFFTTMVGESSQELTYLLERVPGRSGLDRSPSQDRRRRPDRQQHLQPVPVADILLFGEVIGGSQEFRFIGCLMVSIISCTPFATSMRQPISMLAPASPSARAIAIRGARTTVSCNSANSSSRF